MALNGLTANPFPKFQRRETKAINRPHKTLYAAIACGLLLRGAVAQTPTISVNVRLVNVFVNVTDSSGAPVPGLTRDDFLLAEDGHPQKIAVFERQSELPLEIVLAIDTSGSVHKDNMLEHDAARRFVRSLLRPVDHLDLMEFSDNVREVVAFTNSPGRVDRGLNGLQRGAGTALYSGIYLASQQLAMRSGRKVLVVVSDGGNTVKGTTYDQALEQAQRGEVLVYPIIDVPVAASAGRDLAGEHALIALAQETGGKYYYADESSLDKTFAQLSEDLRTQYLLGYYPGNRVGSGFRSISVKLRAAAAEPGYTTRNRPGYYPVPSP
jgi:Ca-activated chloride channel homolog